MSLQETAREASSWFEVATRDVSGDLPEDARYVRTKDDAPEWVKAIVYEAHGDFLPDDWRYNVIQDALLWIADSDDPEDSAGEFADSAVDVYTGARLAWLASNLTRPAYVDEARAEFGADADSGITELIGLGQYMEASEVYGLVLHALETVAEETV
jgi:hypothetical protein